MDNKHIAKFDQEILDIYDEFAHGVIDRREFGRKISKFAIGGLTIAGLLSSLSPNYALANQVEESDSRIIAKMMSYSSPIGHGSVNGYMVGPSNIPSKGSVVVIHENRGLNPYIKDVARRLAIAGFNALAPDGLTPLGGYPGNDEDGKEMQKTLDKDKLLEDFIAAFDFLKNNPQLNGKIGAVGFCYGGGVCNAMATRLPELAASVPFYGKQPNADEVDKIVSPLLLHYAGLDNRVNEGWPVFQAELEAKGKKFTAHIYENVNHGFHNDTTPRYDEAAAQLAWTRTISFFEENLS